MTNRQAEIVALVAAVGREMAEDSIICMGWAKNYQQAKAQVTSALKAA